MQFAMPSIWPCSPAIHFGRLVTETDCSTLSPRDWDKAVLSSSGHFLQSWRWGEFKSRFGWSVDRVTVAGNQGGALAQILFQARGPVSVGYVPRGPVLPDGDPMAAADLMRVVDVTSKRRRALFTLDRTR